MLLRISGKSSEWPDDYADGLKVISPFSHLIIFLAEIFNSVIKILLIWRKPHSSWNDPRWCFRHKLENSFGRGIAAKTTNDKPKVGSDLTKWEVSWKQSWLVSFSRPTMNVFFSRRKSKESKYCLGPKSIIATQKLYVWNDYAILILVTLVDWYKVFFCSNQKDGTFSLFKNLDISRPLFGFYFPFLIHWYSAIDRFAMFLMIGNRKEEGRGWTNLWQFL